jgi:tetratricopeptide (TPR) repeat protein
MIETPILQAVQYRLTQHYIGKLRQANLALEHTRENSNYWFRLIEQDWAQIKNWQEWTSVRSADDLQCALFCVTFGAEGHEYVSVRQSPAERLIWYRQALVAAQQIGDAHKERMLLYHVGTTSYQVGDIEEAEQCAKRLLAVGRSPKDRLSLGDGWFIIGNIHSHRTELDAAESAFRKALKHFEACHAEMMLGHAAQGIARIMIFRGQYEEALTYATQYLKIIEAAGRESDFSLAYHTLSNIHIRLGNLDEAKNYGLKAVEIARRLGYIRMIPSNLLMLGYAELALNELDSAWDHFQETITAARQFVQIRSYRRHLQSGGCLYAAGQLRRSLELLSRGFNPRK